MQKKILLKEIEWKDYGGKHFESVWTRFYQGCILPKKFNIDKRKAHYSSLILSKQLSRDAALELLNQEPYPVKLQAEDKEYVLSKLNLSENEFEKIMASPVREHEDFNTEIRRVQIWTKIFLMLEKLIFYVPRPFQTAKFFKYKLSKILKIS